MEVKKAIKRKCQGCANVLNREDLIKITVSGGKLFINPGPKILGRSMYVCKNVDCIKTVIKKKKIFSALKFKNFEEVEKAHAELLKLV